VEDNGLKKIQAVIAIMRKLLHALLKNMTAFDNTRFYRLPANDS